MQQPGVGLFVWLVCRRIVRGARILAIVQAFGLSEQEPGSFCLLALGRFFFFWVGVGVGLILGPKEAIPCSPLYLRCPARALQGQALHVLLPLAAILFC